MAKDLVALKVDPQTRTRVKILAAEQNIEMSELIRLLVEAEWRKTHPKVDPSST